MHAGARSVVRLSHAAQSLLKSHLKTRPKIGVIRTMTLLRLGDTGQDSYSQELANLSGVSTAKAQPPVQIYSLIWFPVPSNGRGSCGNGSMAMALEAR